MFYRFTYDNSSAVNSLGGNNFQPLKSRDNTPGNAAGFDLTRGTTVHSIRFAYNHYSNNIDAVQGADVFNPAPGISLNFGGWDLPVAPARKRLRKQCRRTLRAS